MDTLSYLRWENKIAERLETKYKANYQNNKVRSVRKYEDCAKHYFRNVTIGGSVVVQNSNDMTIRCSINLFIFP